MSTRAHEPPKTSDVKLLEDFCLVATSEEHEHHECLKNNGNLTEYGSELSLFSVAGISERLIKTWINVLN